MKFITIGRNKTLHWKSHIFLLNLLCYEYVMEQDKWYVCDITLYYVDSKGKNNPLKPGTKFKLFCHYKNGKSCIRWGNKLFIEETKLIHIAK